MNGGLAVERNRRPQATKGSKKRKQETPSRCGVPMTELQVGEETPTKLQALQSLTTPTTVTAAKTQAKTKATATATAKAVAVAAVTVATATDTALIDAAYRNGNGEHSDDKKQMTKEEKVTSLSVATAGAELEVILCSMCGRGNGHTLVDLRDNEPMKQTLISYWELPRESIKSMMLRSVCVQCVYKINAHKELTQSLRTRLQRLAANGQLHNGATEKIHQKQLLQQQQQQLAVAPPTPNTSPNNFLNPTLVPEGTALHMPDLERSYSPVVRLSQTPHMRPPSPAPHTPTTTTSTNEQLPLQPNDHCTAQMSSSQSRSSSPQQLTSDYSMLEVFHERVVSPLTTECGGGTKNKQSYQRVRSVPVQLVCPHCTRCYWRKDFYAKHMRRCNGRHRYARSVAAIRAARSHGDADDNTNMSMDDALMRDAAQSVISPLTPSAMAATTTATTTTTISSAAARAGGAGAGAGAAVANSFKRVFHCSMCAVTVENIRKLREHKRIHLKRFYCDICGGEFTTLHEFEFHHIVCVAKCEALNESADAPETITLGERRDSICSVSENLPARRMTRARSRALSKAASFISTPAHSVHYAEAARGQRQPVYDGDNQETAKHVYSCNLNNNERDDNVDDDDVDSEEDEDDDVSDVDTMYTKRLCFTGHWVEEHSNSQSLLSLCDNNLYDYPYDDDVHLQINTYKEYDLYLLDRLKAEIIFNSFTCFVPECNFRTDSLPKMMVHDYLDHFKKSWFYCQKCGHCFTSKVFLDYHLDRQNEGRFICYKCGDIFEFQHQLDRHFIRHTKCVNYRCNYCKFEFLTKNELLEHCSVEQHDPNGERTLIGIDPTMTIVNPVPPERTLERCDITYGVKMLDMHLPPTPTKRCTPIERNSRHLPAHLQQPYQRNRIGEVEFRNQRNPNCWGWI